MRAGGPRTPLGVTINWARSVLERRRVEDAVDHIRTARAAGLLRGLMFSGCTGEATSQYGAWKDTHMPHSAVAAESLLTPAEVTRALAAADGRDGTGTAAAPPLLYTGVKIAVLPRDDVEHSVSTIAGLLACMVAPL